MNAIRSIGAAAVLAAGVLAAMPSHAHGGAGEREFPATLTTDDPAVKDEASLPTIVHVRRKDDAGGPDTHESDVNFEIDKTLTENLGIAIASGYSRVHQPGSAHAAGWEDLSTTLKYQYAVSAEHEFISSVGVTREWGRTGSRGVADDFGTTTPTFYFGKGLGDLPIGWLRPFAVTGTVGLEIPDGGSGAPRTWNAGLALEYSIPYLQDQVEDLGLPGWIGRLTPLVEWSYSRPTGGSQPTTGIVAPGVIYTSKNWQLGVEALLPATKATNTRPGVLVQFHVFFSDLLPGLAKPVF